MNEDRVNVLLVEDSPSDARLLCESLQDYPLQRFEVEQADRLDEAIAWLARRSFDVILLDLNLPDSHSVETCQRMSRAAGQMPIIVLTGADDEATAVEAMRLGVQDYLVKGPSYERGVIGRTIRYAVERSRSQQALRESEERLRATFYYAGVGLAEVAEDDRIIAANDCLCQILGYPRDELLGKTIHELTAPEDRAKSDALNTQLHQRRTDRLDYEKRYLKRDGTRLWVHVTVSAIYDADGRWRRSIGTIEDITDRKGAQDAMQEANEQLQQQAEELLTQTEELREQAEKLVAANTALRESEARHRRLIENLKGSHFIYRHDTRGVFQFVSESLTDILGYTQDEFLAHYSKYMTDHPANQAVHQHTELTLRGTRQPPYEVNIWHKDGSSRWLEVQEVPVFDAQDQVIGVEGVAQDITERKRAEEALRESEARFRQLADAMPQLVWTAEPDGRVDYYNERYKEFRGIALTADGSFHWALVLHQDDVAPTVQAWQHAIRTGEIYQIEHRVQLADGSFRWYLSRGIPVRDREGRIVKWFGTATDIDDVKRAEQALRELTATLESKVAERTAELEHRARQLQKLTLELSEAEDRERRRVAEILHDDLQQVLAAAKFHLNLMRHRTKQDASLQAIGGQIDQMLKDAIEKSRSLSHELSPAVLHYGDLVETLGWLAGQVQSKHGLVVRVHAQGSVGLQSDTLKGFLYRTAQELLFNVVKHARVLEAGIRIRRYGRYVCLSVSDRGRGFDPQGLREAAGFGLFSIRERIELLGGRMKIKSALGQGSRFFVVVPDAEKTEGIVGVGPRVYPAPGNHAGKEGGHGGPHLRVLVADDHEIVREGLISVLSEEQAVEVVGEATNGREAVDLAARLQPDVVIMDVSMPLIDGDDATRQIKTHLPKTRVVALSMHNEPETVEKMYQAGAESYVLKTAPSEELLIAIRGKSSEA